MVKNPLKNYKFWFKLIGGVILLIFTIAMVLPANKTLREQLVVGVFGGIVLVYGLYRIFPLVKTLDKKWSKILCLIEIILDIVVGVMMLVGGFTFNSEETKFTTFMVSNFRYFLGAVVYLRGLIYCITSIIICEKSDWKQFIANIACLTFGVVIFVRDDFGASNLAWVMIVLSGLSGAYLVGEGGFDYGNYRKNFKEARDGDKKEKDDEVGPELGEASETSEVGDSPKDRDEIHIPEENNDKEPVSPVN